MLGAESGNQRKKEKCQQLLAILLCDEEFWSNFHPLQQVSAAVSTEKQIILEH